MIGEYLLNLSASVCKCVTSAEYESTSSLDSVAGGVYSISSFNSFRAAVSSAQACAKASAAARCAEDALATFSAAVATSCRADQINEMVTKELWAHAIQYASTCKQNDLSMVAGVCGVRKATEGVALVRRGAASLGCGRLRAHDALTPTHVVAGKALAAVHPSGSIDPARRARVGGARLTLVISGLVEALETHTVVDAGGADGRARVDRARCALAGVDGRGVHVETRVALAVADHVGLLLLGPHDISIHLPFVRIDVRVRTPVRARRAEFRYVAAQAH